MLHINAVSYRHPEGNLLFENLTLNLQSKQKMALIGNNGSGKSTLLKIVSGVLAPTAGSIVCSTSPYLLPQQVGQLNTCTLANILGVDQKLGALQRILQESGTEADFLILNDDWLIEERCREVLDYWQLPASLQLGMHELSGGQKARALLAAAMLEEPDCLLLDEPGNHLDRSGRALLYSFIESYKRSLLLVSHDRTLLEIPSSTAELSPTGIQLYGGNYAYYKSQKEIEATALQDHIRDSEKQLRKARDKQKDMLERRQRLDSRGKAKQQKSGVAKIMMNTMRNRAEQSTAGLREVHSDKIATIAETLKTLRNGVNDPAEMRIQFDNSRLHKGKILFKAEQVNLAYGVGNIWSQNISETILSGERIALKGDNGAGKTSFIKLILGQKEASTGTLNRAFEYSVYVDQDYSLIDKGITVFAMAQKHASGRLEQHEIGIRLNRFLFGADDWDKSCDALSGGERMRLILCCLLLSGRSPDLIILDEPVNNLDIINVNILRHSLSAYQGTLLVVSHDENFLKDIGISRSISITGSKATKV